MSKLTDLTLAAARDGLAAKEFSASELTKAHIEAVALKKITIQDLLNRGIVEYIDVNEENNCLIAISEDELKRGVKERKLVEQEGKYYMSYTHLEIDPLTLLGVVAGLIPFPHHNQ